MFRSHAGVVGIVSTLTMLAALQGCFDTQEVENEDQSGAGVIDEVAGPGRDGISGGQDSSYDKITAAPAGGSGSPSPSRR